MNNIELIEPLIKELQKLVIDLLMQNRALDKMIVTCKRFLALKECANFPKIITELSSYIESIDAYNSKFKKLLEQIKKF